MALREIIMDVTDRAGRLLGIVTGPLTDAQLRAVPVPVSGTVATGGLTDAQLRATPVPVSADLTKIAGVAVLTGGLDGSQGVGGLAAIGAQRVGNPVLVAGADASGLLRTFFFVGDNADAVTVAANNILRVAGEGYVFNGSNWDRARGNSAGAYHVPVASTGGAALTKFRNAALTNTAVAVKASAGKIHWYNFFNPGVALAYVHLYDLAAASVTVGTTVPNISIALPSSATATVGVECGVPAQGLAFATAIAAAASTTPAGGVAPATALVVNVGYI